MSGRGKRMCVVCSAAPAAFPRVDYCFTCWPSGPVTPPPCLSCGSREQYFVAGLCHRCHRDGHPGVDSCRDCHAWGATRKLGWLCAGCVSWRATHPVVAPCSSCSASAHLGEEGVCRLCRRQAALLRGPRQKLDVIAANRHGQQLFLADMIRAARRPPTDIAPPGPQPEPPAACAVHAVQLPLFPVHRDLTAHRRSELPAPRDPARAAALEQRVREHAATHGWNERTSEDTRAGIRVLLGLQDDPGTPIKDSDIAALRGLDLPTWTVRQVLADAGILDDDRAPTRDAWFARQIDGLPEAMREQLCLWYDIMRHGCPTPPRRRPRSPKTTDQQLRWALPILRIWASAGHLCLREISRADVLDALPASGNPRANAGQGLKSIFRVLKARKVLFLDPTARVATGHAQDRRPLPADLPALRAALDSPDPAYRAVVALIAFHGLRTAHLQAIQLTDVRDGRLHMPGRVIVLAPPVRDRLGAYLDHRAATWPQTTNPYLFINRRTATRGTTVGTRWIRLAVGPDLTPAAIREDRILDEALATAGDARRLHDLFGLSINAATRYTNTVDHPELTEPERSIFTPTHNQI